MTKRERDELRQLVSGYETPRAAALSVLKELQAKRGWISDDTLEEAAELVGLSATELESIATFYPMIFRRLVGRHIISVCDSIVCWMMGGERVTDHLRKRLGIEIGETTADGEFTLLPISCTGDCDHAPAIVVDGEHHTDVTPEKIDAILEQARRAGAGDA